MRLVPSGWADFQHYKERSPPWIKLHKKLLDNYEFQSLPVASRALAPMLWLLASDHDRGEIDAAPKKLAFRLRMSEREVTDALKPLIDNGFFEVLPDASDTLAERKQVADPETEREKRQRERQKRADEFDTFWAAYPKKEAKKDANDAWQKVDTALESILAGVERLRRTETWLKAGGQFVPLPATFLRGRRWEDEATTTTVTVPSRIEPDPELARLRADAGRAVNVPQSVRDLTKKLTAGFTQ